jgi:hypothetical protein
MVAKTPVKLQSIGYSRNNQDTDADARNGIFTAEVAKKALLEMDSGEIPPGVIVPRPKDEPIEFLNADEIAVGIWRCNLKEKTFEASAFFPQAIRHKRNDVSGVFERTPDGKWVAKVKESSSAH